MLAIALSKRLDSANSLKIEPLLHRDVTVSHDEKTVKIECFEWETKEMIFLD